MELKLTPDIIRACRINLGLSQGKLARAARISGALLGAIERKDRPLLENVAARIRSAIPYTDLEITDLMSTIQRLNK